MTPRSFAGRLGKRSRAWAECGWRLPMRGRAECWFAGGDSACRALTEAKEGTVTADLYGEPHFVERSWGSSGSHSHSPRGSCPACGAPLSAESDQGPVLRVAIPQPIAAALRLTGTLSGREGIVFELLGMGYDNRSIARDMNISERTVKRHITVILAKLHLESRLQAGLTALIISMCSPVRAAWPEGRIADDSRRRDNNGGSHRLYAE